MISTSWITNVHHVSDTTIASIPAKTLKGYVQAADCDQHLQITLHSELQMLALNKIIKMDRILHTDATGKLVSIPKYMKDCKQIMNYALLVKDTSDLEKQGLLVSESFTSRHDTSSIVKLLQEI